MKSRCKELIFIDLVVIQDVKSIKSKLFYETIKSKLMMVAEKSALYSAESSSLGDYPDKQRVYWKTSSQLLIHLRVYLLFQGHFQVPHLPLNHNIAAEPERQQHQHPHILRAEYNPQNAFHKQPPPAIYKIRLSGFKFNRFGKSSVSAVHRLFAKTPLFCVLLPLLAALCAWLVVRTSRALKPPKNAFIQRFRISRAGFPGVSRSNVICSARAHVRNTAQQVQIINYLYLSSIQRRKRILQKRVKNMSKRCGNRLQMRCFSDKTAIGRSSSKRNRKRIGGQKRAC
jgi:hypothetical protein